MELIPYLHFGGNCEEALNSYKKILNAKIDNISRFDNPAMQVPEEYKNKILHAVFAFNGNQVYASDVFPGQSVTGNNIALSLSVDDLEESKKIFSELSKGGKVLVNYEKQFWGDWHGNFIDRYGIYWMVNYTDRK
jgi:PhnB protein